MLEISESFVLQTMLKSTALLGFSAGMLGVFLSYQRRSIEIGVISAGSFVGVMVLFLFSALSLPVGNYIFNPMDKDLYSFIGSIIGGIIAMAVLNILYKTDKLHPHIIQSLMTAIFLAIGFTLITAIRQAGGFDNSVGGYLFGETTSLTIQEYHFIRTIAIVVIFLLFLFFKRIKVVTFNLDIAKTSHFRVNFYINFINILLICLVILSIKVMGVFLAVSIFIIPSLIARLWSNNFFVIMILSGLFGAFGGIIGTIIVSNIHHATSGVTITITLSLLFFISLIFSPNKGIFRFLRKKNN